MRMSPRVWIGVAIWAGYILVIFVVSSISGVPFPEIGTSATSTWRGAVLDLVVGAVGLVVVATILGWWGPALGERSRAKHKWPVFVPIIMLAAAVSNLLNTDWSQFDMLFVLALVALGVFVGFNEEFMARGLLLTALRTRIGEGWVWFVSSALFGAMHLVNAALGAPLAASLLQAAMAFASGTAFYIVRRVTGSLIWAMVLHGLWDVSVFSVGHAPISTAYAAFLAPVIGVLSLAVVYWVIKGADESQTTRTFHSQKGNAR